MKTITLTDEQWETLQSGGGGAVKYLWSDGTECEKEDLEEYLTFMSDDFREVPDCFNVEDAEWGGECYEKECIHHYRYEPHCGR